MNPHDTQRRADKRRILLRWISGFAFIAVIATLAFRPALADSCEDDPQAIVSDRDYARGRKALDSGDWKRAVQHFEQAALRHPESAEAQNALGLAHRKSGKFDAALKHYGRALKLDPRSRRAHGEIGEAYLAAGDLPSAERHLDALRGICLLPCDELAVLEREVREYRIRSAASRAQ